MLAAVTTSSDYRQQRARLAARTRWGTATPADRQRMRREDAEQRLVAVLGEPPAGTRWIDRIITNVDAAPPLTKAQRDRLALLLHAGTAT